ncbi:MULTISPECIES: LysR family transcriptional regulator [unclassified Oceanobacter]|jgi:DNA-binding transcriptional LysR family regulator|uniref:LysR family transcriptional regulator n=1 Tax=unclassified Oceanobacter TaxID=2620260 RepID=UPI0026E47AED|nr:MULTISPECIES: LysR family transcriptional regulator [unclassified Oceanobacter]MDO6682326.1 LysR family transcriptional regulator [Oceanobacter sp. 5_MG-2023]MDP2506038.1 LysR family transcriptional regulator [Oceanobacter sp. 3_MG-2023]MDP2547617.1 LysR family transcriptional regulator [Oceanobacter sp. 4_MG-2023]
MDKFRAMATFVAIVDNGSLTAAANTMNRSPAAIVRALAELEKYLGVRLLNRSTRRIALTDEGREYLQYCRRILADVEAAEFRLDVRKTTLTGSIQITAPVMFGRLHLAPLLNQWLVEHPGMAAELVLLDRMVDVIEEGFDLALRIGHLADSSLIALPLGITHTRICASPTLIQRLGQPQHPTDLANWPGILFAPQGNQWRFIDHEKLVIQAVTPVLTSNQVDVVLAAAVDGLGVARVMSYQAQGAIQNGQLLSLLEPYAPAPFPVQFVYPHNRLVSPRVRQCLDWMVPRLRQRLQDPS